LNCLCFPLTLRRKFVVCLILSFHFKNDMKKEKTHNMLLLMLAPWFKNLLFSIFICWSWARHFHDEKYDKESLQPILLKCYHHLHLMINCLNHKVDEDCILDIFEMIANTSELVKELVNIKLLILGDFMWILWRSSAFSNGGRRMNSCSPLLVFLSNK
jgi:hypothetical protein